MKKVVLLIAIGACVATAIIFAWSSHRESISSGQAPTPTDDTILTESGRSQEQGGAGQLTSPNPLLARLEAKREEFDHQTAQRKSDEAKSKAQADGTLPAEPQLSTAEFISSLSDAIAKGDAVAISSVLQNAPKSSECINALKSLMASDGVDKDMRRYAAEALVRIGTTESMGYVLNQALAAHQAGNPNLASTLLNSLDAPTTPEGAQVLFDLLLGRGNYASIRSGLSDEFVNAARKALRNAPNREAIGSLAAQLYLNPQILANNTALSELFDGIALPGMYSALAVRATQMGSTDNATQFLDRLAQVDDQGVVHAMIQAGNTEPRLFQAAAERLYAWSLEHPQQSQTGLFMDYLTDSRRTPNERILAAYGLAGVANRQDAMRTITKAFGEESSPDVKTSLASLQQFLAQNQPQSNQPQK